MECEPVPHLTAANSVQWGVLSGAALGFFAYFLSGTSSSQLYTVTGSVPTAVSAAVPRVPAMAARQPFAAASNVALPAHREFMPSPGAADSRNFWGCGAVLSVLAAAVTFLLSRSGKKAVYQPINGSVGSQYAMVALAGRPTATVPVKDISGASVGTEELRLRTAGETARHVVHRKLVAELANRRQSNAHTKTRGEVSGGGKKPYKQKGTGNARRGSNRSPLMRHGGVAFGPRNTRNFKQKINRKEGRLAISSLLQNRASLVTVVNDLENIMNGIISTKKAAQLIGALKDPAKGEKLLLVIDAPEKWPVTHPLVMSTNNIPTIRLMNQQNLAVADLLWPHQIFISDKAMAKLNSRLGAVEEPETAAVA